MRIFMQNRARLGQILAGSIAAVVVCVSTTSMLSDETANRIREDHANFESNLFYCYQLERTNPAMLKTSGEKAAAQEHNLVMNGYRTIPYLGQFVVLFPTNVAFRFFSRQPAKPHLWTMQTGLFGRHLLRMEVLFTVDATQTNVVSYEPPSFSMVTFDEHWPNSRGPNELSRQAFTAADWTNLVSARGDLRTIGFKGSTNSPIPDFEVWRSPLW
jgi:hypothetical protein